MGPAKRCRVAWIIQENGSQQFARFAEAANSLQPDRGKCGERMV